MNHPPVEPMPEMQRVVLLLEYQGTAFSGSQSQANAYTVQQALESALKKLNLPFSGVGFAGRTDAGVHAKGQVVHVDMPAGALTHIPDFRTSLNAVVDPAIAVQQVETTSDFRFHATLTARWRWYQYRIDNRPVRSVWTRPNATWIRHPLDLEAMQAGAQQLLGTHDFSSFKAANAQTDNNVCRVIQCRLTQESSELVLDMVANRFLYKMVRNVAGTLIAMGKGRHLRPEDMPRILEQQDRDFAGPTAPARGLTLMAVHYPEAWGFFQNGVYVTRLNQVVQESSAYEKDILRKAS